MLGKYGEGEFQQIDGTMNNKKYLLLKDYCISSKASYILYILLGLRHWQSEHIYGHEKWTYWQNVIEIFEN